MFEIRLIRRTAFLLAGLAAGAAFVHAAQAQEHVIGIPQALTGPYAFVGVPVRNGIVLGLEEGAAAHGLKLQLIVKDDASEKTQAISMTNRMAVRDKALLIVGPTSSIEGTAAAPVANDLKIPLFTSAVSEDVTRAGPWSYKVTASPPVIMRALGEYVVGKLRPKSAVLVFARDNDGFIGQKNAIRDALRAGGVSAITEASVASADTDFTALSTKLAGANADIVYLSMGAEAGAALIIQARQSGLSPNARFVAPPSMSSGQFIKVGGKAVEGTILVADYFVGGGSELNRRFIAAYEKKYSSKPDNWAAVGYSLGTIAAAAIKNAGPSPDRDKVRAALAAMKDVPVVLCAGVWNLDANRDPCYGAAVLTVKDGAFALAP